MLKKLLSECSRRQVLGWLGSGLLFLSGCQDGTSFLGEKIVHRSSADGESGFTWTWKCDDETQPPKDSTETRILRGYGPHFLKRSVAKDLPLRIEGKLCGSGLGGRDVLILVDTSFSMSEPSTDKVDARGSCKRFEAVETILRSISQSEAPSRFALMTFGWGVKVNSNDFFPDAAALYAELLKGKEEATISEILCRGDEEANYEYAFADALELYRDFSPSMSSYKEIYLLSDGLVYEGSEGTQEAGALDELGLLTAVRFGLGESRVFSDLVSTDQSGQSFVTPFSGLGDFLLRVDSYFEDHSTSGFFEYRGAFEPIGSWNQIPLSDKLNNFQVGFNAFQLDTVRFLDGIDLRLNYQGLKGKELVIEGQILWMD